MRLRNSLIRFKIVNFNFGRLSELGPSLQYNFVHAGKWQIGRDEMAECFGWTFLALAFHSLDSLRAGLEPFAE